MTFFQLGKPIALGISISVALYYYHWLNQGCKRTMSKPKKKTVLVGIDIGATTVAVGIVDLNGKVLAKSSLAVEERSPTMVLNLANLQVNQILRKQDFSDVSIDAVGIAVPGIICKKSGVIHSMANYNWKMVPFIEMAQKIFNVPCVLENDGNAALLGECWSGMGKGKSHVVMVTLGSGIGGAVAINGKLLRGAHGMAAEIGHMIIELDGRYSKGTNVHGVWEEYASARAIGEQGYEIMQKRNGITEKNVSSMDSKTVFKLAHEGDEEMKQLVDRSARYIALGCINLVRMIDPELILLTGGLMLAGESFLRQIKRHFEELHWDIQPSSCDIRIPLAGNDAGVLGAAFCALSGE